MPKRPMTPEDLLKITFVGDPQISPDGKLVLFSRKQINAKNKYVSHVWSVDGEGALRQWTQGEKGAGGARWSPDGQSIAFLSGREEPGAQIYVLSVAGGEASKVTDLPEGSLANLKWSPDGRFLSYTFREVHPDWTVKARKEREEKGLSTPPRVIEDTWYRLDGDGYFLGQRHALYCVELATGQTTKLFQGGRYDQFEYDWSPDSKEVVVLAPGNKNPLAEPAHDQLLRIDLQGQSWEIEGLPKGPKGAPAWSPDGNFIAYIGREGDSGGWGCLNSWLYVCPAGGGAAKALTSDGDYCMNAMMLGDCKEAGGDARLQWSADCKSIYFDLGWHGEQHLAQIDVASAKLKFLTSGKQAVSVGNLGLDGKRVPCVFGDAVHLPEIGMIDLQTGAIERITHLNKAFHEVIEVAEPEDVWLESPDGAKVHAWVMKPIGYREPKRYAGVLQVHGGPHGQYGWTFFHEFQVLAAAGYVVVYSNPRGSKGYGENHTAAIKGSWGDKDWIDIQTVIHWMQHQPYIHPGLMGIMGGSYGGYMTNWAVGHCRDFKAAITDRCVSNLVSQGMNSDFPNQPNSYWPGCPWSSLENIAEMWKQSPIAYFDQVVTPMLIIHSEGDLRCNVEQSESVFTALMQQGVEARFVRYPQSTFHGLSRSGPPDLRLHRLHEILRWWAKFLD